MYLYLVWCLRPWPVLSFVNLRECLKIWDCAMLMFLLPSLIASLSCENCFRHQGYHCWPEIRIFNLSVKPTQQKFTGNAGVSGGRHSPRCCSFCMNNLGHAASIIHSFHMLRHTWVWEAGCFANTENKQQKLPFRKFLPSYNMGNVKYKRRAVGIAVQHVGCCRTLSFRLIYLCSATSLHTAFKGIWGEAHA